MKKLWNLILNLLGLRKTVEPQPTQPQVGEPLPSPPSSEGGGLPNKVKMGNITGASDIEEQMIRVAASFIPRIIYSDYFKEEVMKFQFTSTDGKTNQEIYDLFVHSDLIINVDDYSGSWKEDHIWHTEGYENGDGYVHANRYFIQDAISMGSLILHEMAHELGFHHSSASEYTSIPYAMNAIFEIIRKKLGISVPNHAEDEAPMFV